MREATAIAVLQNMNALKKVQMVAVPAIQALTTTTMDTATTTAKPTAIAKKTLLSARPALWITPQLIWAWEMTLLN